MFGFNPISAAAIAEITPFTVGGAGNAVGAAWAVGLARRVGVLGAAGTVLGAAVVFGRTRTYGGVANRRNQAFNFSVDVLSALLWQYNEAPALTEVLEQKQAWYDLNQKLFWQNWINDVFDLRTANDFGCAVWSIILRLPLAIEYDVPDGPPWGFGPYTSGGPPDEGNMNFDRGNFQALVPTVLPLTLDQKRIALQMRYFQLFTHGAVPQINAMLKRLFGKYGLAYVEDHLDMTMTYHFAFKMPHPLLFLFNYYDLLPRPSGVQVNFTYL